MSTMLVTGGAGFIGSNLVDRCVREGRRVVIVDNFDSFYDPARKRLNLSGSLQSSRVTLVEADIRDARAMQTLFENHRFDTVVHLAARAGVRPSIQDPLLYADVNVTGTVVLLDCARRFGCRRFIFASSSSVYGNNRKVPFSESDPVDHPISPYAATKKAGELICHTFHHLYQLPVTCLRFFTVFGPRCRPDLAIAKFTSLIDRGEVVPMFGDGSMRRDFTHIDDILDGLTRAIDRCSGFHIYNLGESRPIELRRMIDVIADALGKPARIERHPQPPGDVDVTYADVSRAQAELGYEPRVRFEDGIADYVAWYRSFQGERR